MKVYIDKTTKDDYSKTSKKRNKVKDIFLAPLWEDPEMKFPDDLETPT